MLQTRMNIDSFLVKIRQFNEFLILLFWAFLLSSHLLGGSTNGTTIGRYNNVMCMDEEREALLKFKQGIKIDSCGMLSSWVDHNKNCCQWRGINCSSHNGHVIKLNLSSPNSGVSMCLEGKVSSSLVDLKHLTYLDLSFNNFTGQYIPIFLGSLVKLKHLKLSNAGFRGEIPHQLGNLSQLTYLDLTSEYLKAASLSWLSHLTLLNFINLSLANLSEATDWLQFLNNLPLLREIHLQYCNLPSPIPWPLSYKNSSSTLSFIDLSYNFMYNSWIFQWLFNLSGISTHLAHLDLSENYLGGPIPTEFGNLQVLSYLDLFVNRLGGPIPTEFGNLQVLSYLDLSVNSLGGPIPTEFGNLQLLSYLDLSVNNLGGNLPNCFANMQSLSYVDLSSNQLEGPIPDTISKIKPLTHLILTSNNFSILPKTIGNLCNLQELELSGNNINDELPMILQSLSGCASRSLMWLGASGNRLNGTISQKLGQLSMLEHLDLSYNDVKGILSHNHFLNLSRLNYLDLSGNPSLVVNMDANWVPPFQLNYIGLGSNILGPQFPMWLLTQNNYSELDISNAGIYDRIPKSFWSSLPSKLSHLNISHNKIYGALPEFSATLLSNNIINTDEYIGDMCIDLSFNNIEGTIPLFPKYFSSLYLNNNRFYNPIPFLFPQTNVSLSNLDLSNNLLSGELPDCWLYFDQLSILRIENNKFSGGIPASIGYLTKLRVLHLRNNSFSGSMPRSIENLTSLVVLDLGHNSFSGHIPPTIGDNLKTLVFLSLRSNGIVGEIPFSLCQMSSLQILDLSVNHITGSIPNCIYNITAMQNGTNLMPQLLISFENGDAYGSIDYNDTATIMWKRKEWSFQDSLGLVKEIDLSNNRLEGEIPIGIFDLIGLVSLDLSGNFLIGSISSKIGQLIALEFLDLSNNHLSGEIPASFTELNFLGILDLSYNHLYGKIPTGTLLQGFNGSAYAGNPELCGLPLTKCPWDQPPNNNASFVEPDEDESDDIFPGMYISVILGFIIGFWGVCGSLVLKSS